MQNLHFDFHRSTLGQFNLTYEETVDYYLLPPQLPVPGAVVLPQDISNVVGPKTRGKCKTLLSGAWEMPFSPKKAEGRERAGRIHVGKIKSAECTFDFEVET